MRLTFQISGRPATVHRMAIYTHGHHDSVLRSHRWRTLANSAAYLLPHLSPEFHVLDVGCGPGTITADLASRVTHVTAVEQTSAALDLARAAIKEPTQLVTEGTGTGRMSRQVSPAPVPGAVCPGQTP